MIYQPREDSFLLEKEVKKRAKGKSFLDMGSGTGIQARAAISAGASSVLVADIDKEAIRKLKNQNIPAVCSNLFSKIREKFDIISFNPPYLPEDKLEGRESALATSGGKQGDEIILKFLKQAKSHLKKNGIILLVISSLTPKKRIFALLKKQGLKHNVLSSEKLFFEALEVWLLR